MFMEKKLIALIFVTGLKVIWYFCLENENKQSLKNSIILNIQWIKHYFIRTSSVLYSNPTFKFSLFLSIYPHLVSLDFDFWKLLIYYNTMNINFSSLYYSNSHKICV